MVETSKQFLIDGKSFVTKTVGNAATVVRTAAKAITQTEKEIAGKFYNAVDNTIEYAKIYNLKFGKNWIKKLGASSAWMAKALTDKKYKEAFKKATGKNSSNISSVAPETSTNVATDANNTDANGRIILSTEAEKILRYPKNIDQNEYDYLKVCAYQYKPRSFARDSKTGELTTEASKKVDNNSLTGDYEDSVKNLTRKKGSNTVFLPMDPAGLQESNNINWGDSQLNPLDAALANISGKTIEGAGEGLGPAAKGGAEATGDAINNLKSAAGTDDVIAGFFAQQAVGKNDIFARATGMAVNNNLELLFQGPSLRSFNYTFKFTPRDQDEANEVRKIIRFFKTAIAPQRSEGKMFLKSPHIFRLEYIFKDGGQHPFLNKMKLCACKNFSVNYAPDGSYMTYDDGSMTSYNLTLGFGELNPIYADDYDESSNDMGY